MNEKVKDTAPRQNGDDDHNELYRTLFEQAADGIFVSDANGRYLDVNPRACEMLGYTREEVLSKSVHDLISAADLTTAPLKLDQLHPGNIIVSERRLVCKDGSLLPIEISGRRLSDGRMLGIARDISERKKAGQLLVESEERYRYLFENNPHPMWVYDLETLAFLAVNDAAITKYGYSREEFLSMTIKDIRPQEDLPHLMENLAQPRLTLEYSTGWRHRLNNGTVIDVDISSHTIDLGGRRSALVIAQDVTEQVQAKARARYMTRLYATLSQVNQTIVRVRNQEALFRSICEVAVRFGEFRMAWIGLLNQETGAVEPAAFAGHEQAYLDSIIINVNNGVHSRGPTGTAIRSGKVEFSDDIAHNKRMEPWRDDALDRGYRSSAAVPIRLGGKIIGTLNLYAREPGFFSEEERSLLEEIGLDISYALDRIKAEDERKLTESALRASEKRYRQLFEQNQAGVYYTSLDGTIIDCNEAFVHILGYDSIEDIKEHRATELYFDEAERSAYLEKLKAHGSMTDFELRLKRKDGSPVWILENVSIATDHSGQLLNTQGTLIDITERKLAEEALRASEKRYRQLFETNQAGVFYTSQDGRIIGCNDTFARIFGYDSSEEIMRHSAKELYPDIEVRNKYLDTLKREGSLTNYELPLQRKDGSPVWILENVNIVADETGRPEQIQGTLIDITERKLAEESLRESEQKYQTLAETMTALYETTRDLVSERDLTSLLHTIVERAARLLGTTAGGLYLSDPKNERVRCVVSYNTPRDYTGVELEYGEGAAGLVAQTGKPLIVNDYSRWSGRARIYESEKPFQAVLSVPMIWQGELIGVIHMLDFSGKRVFTEADKELMILFANQAAIATKNASLYSLAQAEIAERRQAEAALRESETFLKEAQRVGRLGSWDWDADTDTITWSEEYYQIYGFDPGQSPPNYEEHLKTYTPESAARLDAAVQKAMRDGAPYVLDLEQARPDGTRKWLTARCEIKRDANGRITGLRGTAQDITDRKQAELLQDAVYQIAQTAQTSESLEELVPQIHRIIGSIMPAGNFYIALYDEANNLLDFPYSVDEMDPPISGSLPFGKGLTEYVLRTGESLLCPQSVHDALEQAGEIELVGAPAPIWLGVPLKVETKTIGVMAVQHYTDPNAYGEREQRILEFVSSQVAIALSRKQAEEALRESEIRFATVFRSSPMAIAVTCLKNGHIVDANDAWLNLTGFSREETIGRSPLELNIWADHEEREHLLSILGKKSTVEGFEFTMRKKSGELAEILLSAELIELMGVPNMLSMALDISERKRSEEKIRQQVNRLTALNTIDRVIASSFDLGMTLNMLVSNISQELNLSAALVMLYNPNSMVLEYAAGYGFRGSDVTHLNIHLGEGHAGKVALERRMEHIPDLAKANPPFGGNITDVEEFVSYFGLPLIAKGEVKGVLEVFHRQPLEPEPDWLAFLETMAEQAAIAIDNMQLFEGMQRSNLELSLAYDATIEGWSYALDLRDRETEGHTQRVTDKTVELGRAFGLGNHELIHIRRGALLHDIGKMGVPDSILLKPGALTDEEWVVMKMHPTFARQMLERIHYLKPALDIPYCHHEKWDGSGYPRGLSGKQIPLPARIFAVVDVWDALGSDRPYRPAWPRSETLKHIKAGAGSHFDPEVVEMFLNLEQNWNKP